MTASAIPALIDALLTLCKASPALDGITVHDGWPWQADTADALYIGCDDPWTRGRSHDGGSSDQEWATLGARDRDEEATVTCAAAAWDGSGDTATARSAAYQMVDAVQELLDADPRLGVPGVLKAVIANTRYRPGMDQYGAVCLVLFDVRATVRLM